MDGGELERLWDVLRPRDTSALVSAIVVCVVVQIVVLFLFRALGFFLNLLSWLLGLAISVSIALYILNNGVPEALGGEQIDRLIDDARRWLGI